MNKIIPFSKTIELENPIGEITDSSVTHNLKLDNNIVEGDIVFSGKYKTSPISINEEEFEYKLPFTIDIDSKYDTTDLSIEIKDYNYEQDDNSIKLDISIELNNLKEIENEIDEEEVELEETKEEILDNFNIKEESFSTYYVYNVRENDTIEYILEKYKISKEELLNYNDLDNISVGTKLVIPCSNDR